MKNKIFLFPLSLAVIFFASIIIIFSPVGKKNIINLPTSTEWKTYTNSYDNYQISYLSSWKITKDSSGEFVLEKPNKALISINSLNKQNITLPIKTWINKTNTKKLNHPYNDTLINIIDNDNVLKNIPNIVTITAEYLGQGGKEYIFPHLNKIFSITGIYYFDYSTGEEQIPPVSVEIDQILSTFKFTK